MGTVYNLWGQIRSHTQGLRTVYELRAHIKKRIQYIYIYQFIPEEYRNFTFPPKLSHSPTHQTSTVFFLAQEYQSNSPNKIQIFVVVVLSRKHTNTNEQFGPNVVFLQNFTAPLQTSQNIILWKAWTGQHNISIHFCLIFENNSSFESFPSHLECCHYLEFLIIIMEDVNLSPKLSPLKTHTRWKLTSLSDVCIFICIFPYPSQIDS